MNPDKRIIIFMISLLLFILLSINTASSAIPIQLSDQGTSVRSLATGFILDTGNLTIEIYDAESGGNKIWNNSYTNAIINGSWNVMLGEVLELNLTYGEKYWKDYRINNADINYTNATGGTIARRAFYSPLGRINKTFVENGTNVFVDISGDTMVGDLIVNNGTGGKLFFVNTSGDRVEIWHPQEGANDYLSILHDGSSGIVNTQSGSLYFQEGGTSVARTFSDGLAGTSANANNLGATTVEWQGLYLGEDALSGAYFGLDQNWRLYYNETSEDALILENKTGATVMSWNGSSVGIGTASPSSKLTVAGLSGYNVDVIEWERDDSAIKGILGFGKGGANNVFMGSRTNHDLLIMTNNLTRMTIESSGDIGLGGQTAPGMALHVGTGASTHTLTNSENDTYVTGRLEVDGRSYFDGTASFYANLLVIDNVPIRFGNNANSHLDWSTAQATENTLVWGLGTTADSIIFTNNANIAKDFDHPAQSNPTIFMQADEDPDADNTKWGSVSHDNNSFIIDSGYGNITLDDTTTVSGDLELADNEVGILLLDMYDDGTFFNINTSNNISINNNVKISGNLNVTGTAYLGSVSLESENISVTNVLPLNAETGVTVRNGSGGKLLFTNTTSGRLEIWNPLEAANDYVSIWHDGTGGYVRSFSGALGLTSSGVNAFWNGASFYSGINQRDLGLASNEWRGLYLGNESSSGAYFGLGQEARIWMNNTNRTLFIESSAANVSVIAPRFRVYDDARADDDYLEMYHDGTNAYITSTATTGYFFINPANSILSTNAHIYSAYSNLRDIGLVSGEWRALFLGENASSGTYYGLGQNYRTFYDTVTGLNTTGLLNYTLDSDVKITGKLYGGSTIEVGDSVQITGDLNVTGTSYLGDIVLNSSNITVSNLIGRGGDNIRIGDAGVDSHSLAADDDLFVSGKFEVDGLSYFDSDLTIDGNLNVTGTSYLGNIDFDLKNISLEDEGNLILGSGEDTHLDWSTAEATENTLVWGLGVDSLSLIFTTDTLRNKDHDHSAQSNPTIFVQSNEDPDNDNTRWGSIAHDNTSFVIDSGSDEITLDDQTYVSDNLTMGDNTVGTDALTMWDNGTHFVIETANPLVFTQNITYQTIYAQLSDLDDQTFSTADAKQPINFSTIDESYGLEIETNNITILTAGVYSLAAQPQVSTGAGGAGTFHMWLEKHNTTRWVNVSNSNVELVLASNEENVIPLITTLRLEEDEMIRIMGSVSDTAIELDAQSPANEPNIPSIIFTMFKLG